MAAVSVSVKMPARLARPGALGQFAAAGKFVSNREDSMDCLLDFIEREEKQALMMLEAHQRGLIGEIRFRAADGQWVMLRQARPEDEDDDG